MRLTTSRRAHPCPSFATGRFLPTRCDRPCLSTPIRSLVTRHAVSVPANPLRLASPRRTESFRVFVTCRPAPDLLASLRLAIPRHAESGHVGPSPISATHHAQPIRCDSPDLAMSYRCDDPVHFSPNPFATCPANPMRHPSHCRTDPLRLTIPCLCDYPHPAHPCQSIATNLTVPIRTDPL